MKEYQKLARDYNESQGDRNVYHHVELIKAYESAFLKAREMALAKLSDCSITNVWANICDLGEKEV